MAFSAHKLLNFTVLAIFLFLFTWSTSAHAEETSLKLMTDAFEWPTAMSLYDVEEEDGDLDGDIGSPIGRRTLFWRAMRHYYISYGALSANRVPCPPRSGRSYYSHNCFKARGPVRPYYRGCSKITRCRR